MSSHARPFADLYDVFYGDKDYAAEAEFVHRVFSEHLAAGPGDILELACGTGLHAIELARRGHRLVATDYSEAMLAKARANASNEPPGLPIEFLHQDMRTLDLRGRVFDAAFCLFDSIGYVRTNDAVSTVLRNVHRHLRVGGLFLFEFWHAAAFLRHYEPFRSRRWTSAAGEIVRTSETTLDVASQTADVAYTVFVAEGDGRYAQIRETHTNRYFLVQEMTAHLTNAGFTPLRWFAGFTSGEPITVDTWHVVSLARKQT